MISRDVFSMLLLVAVVIITIIIITTTAAVLPPLRLALPEHRERSTRKRLGVRPDPLLSRSNSDR